METREQLMNKIDSLFSELRQYEVEFEDKKEHYIESVDNLYKLTAEGFNECSRRLDRLEEVVHTIIGTQVKYSTLDTNWLKDKAKELYEEQAATKKSTYHIGEYNE